MAITVGTNTDAYSDQNQSSLTFSATMDSGSNGMMVVQLSLINGPTVDPVVSSVTYNGVAMTQAVSKVKTNRLSAIYYLVNPATGANDVVVTLGASITRIFASATSLTGVAQSSPVDGTNTAEYASASNWDLSVTTSVANSIIFGANTQTSTRTVSADSSQTTNYDINQDNRGWGCYKATTTAGAYAIDYTLSSTADGSMAGCGFKESTTHIKKFNGIPYANLKKINGVPIANIKKLNGIA